ncbi:MAG: DNA mismatch repair protein MutS [Acidobacteriota bacterium]|nr:DNA mismatch repair protein MutS [Acidobacteriota bacterium]
MSNYPEASPRDPEAEYRRRIDALRAALVPLKRRDRLFGYAKLTLLFIGPLFLLWIVLSKQVSIYWVLVPVLVFISIEVLHERVSRAIDRNARAAQFYERGIARINDQWAGTGETGERFASPSHAYARDLDLFGNASLFQFLCEARTAAGEETLASWLLAPAAPEEVLARQSAVADLRDRIQLREDLTILTADSRAAMHPVALVQWAEPRFVVASVVRRIAAMVLSLAWLASLGAWIVWGLFMAPQLLGMLFLIFLLISAVNAVFGHAHRRWIELGPTIEASCNGLAPFATVMSRFEAESFAAPKLAGLQSRLRGKFEKPSRSIRRLARLIERLESNRNLILVFANRFVFYRLETIFAIEHWHRKFGPSVRGWIAAIGELEALSSLAGYAFEHPADTFPEFTAESPCFLAEGLAHPLIPAGRAVRNDVHLGRELQLMIVSGPNMAGKSTFLRAVGLNAVLAQCGAPVRARRLRLSPLGIAASVCVLDSLQGGISRFYAEILRVKLTIDLANGPFPVLFLLDELLGGTNSQDRRVGAERIVTSLVDRDGIGLITTHDLALAQIADALGPRAANFHFEDRVEDGRLIFDYRLSPGVVRTSNALQLMRSIGIDV